MLRTGYGLWSVVSCLLCICTIWSWATWFEDITALIWLFPAGVTTVEVFEFFLFHYQSFSFSFLTLSASMHTGNLCRKCCSFTHFLTIHICTAFLELMQTFLCSMAYYSEQNKGVLHIYNQWWSRLLSEEPFHPSLFLAISLAQCLWQEVCLGSFFSSPALLVIYFHECGRCFLSGRIKSICHDKPPAACQAEGTVVRTIDLGSAPLLQHQFNIKQQCYSSAVLVTVFLAAVAVENTWRNAQRE